MRIPLVTVTLMLLGPPSLFAQDWIEYSNQTDFFVVSLPGQPKVSDITYATDYAVTLPGRVYTAGSGPERYTVTVVDYTQAVKKHAERVQKCQANGGDGDLCDERSLPDLRSAITYAAWNLMNRGSKVTHFLYTQADRVEGVEVHLANPDASHTLAAVFMHQNRLYILEGTVPGGFPPPLVFQQSMGFLDNDGKRVRYRSSYSNGFPPPPRVQ